MNDNMAYEILCYLSENSPLVDWEVERDLVREAFQITARVEVRGRVVACSMMLSRYELNACKDVSVIMNHIISKLTGDLSRAIISWRPEPGEEMPLPMSAWRSVATNPHGSVWETPVNLRRALR
jgi:hypothetical protein